MSKVQIGTSTIGTDGGTCVDVFRSFRLPSTSPTHSPVELGGLWYGLWTAERPRGGRSPTRTTPQSPRPIPQSSAP